MQTMKAKRHKIELQFQIPVAALLGGLLIFSNPNRASAQSESTPLLRSTEVTEVEAEGYAEAMQRLLISHALDLYPDEQIDKLAELLQRAQEAWLSGSIDSSRTLFNQISELALTQDWREPERETIVYAMMRLAQLSQNEIERDKTLKRALVFSPDAHVDEALFPPPLLQRLQELKNASLESNLKNGNAIRFRPSQVFRSAAFIRINGKKHLIDADGEILLRPGEYRISVYSDHALPLNLVMSANELRQYQYRPRLLARGTCSDPKLEVSSTSVKLDVLYANGCIRTWGRTQWLPMARSSKPSVSDSPMSDTAGITSAATPSRIPSEWLPHPEEGADWSPAPPEKKFWEKKETWIWVGITAVVAGSVYAIYQNQHPAKTRVQPNSSEIN